VRPAGRKDDNSIGVRYRLAGSEIRAGPAEGIDFPTLCVNDADVLGLRGAFLTAKGTR
jgi:hypothetical protein